MFVIKMVGLYGMENKVAFYRQSGDCFNFASSIQFATRFESLAACERILSQSKWYCKQFGASKMEAVKLEGEG